MRLKLEKPKGFLMFSGGIEKQNRAVMRWANAYMPILTKYLRGAFHENGKLSQKTSSQMFARVLSNGSE